MEENWIRILETDKEDKILEYLKEEFDKNNIQYKIELEEEWEGTKEPKYIGKFVVSIKGEFEKKAEEIFQYYCQEELETVDKEEVEEILEDEEDLEIESQRISRRQKIMDKILFGIVLCMVMSAVVFGIINS